MGRRERQERQEAGGQGALPRVPRRVTRVDHLQRSSRFAPPQQRALPSYRQRACSARGVQAGGRARPPCGLRCPPGGRPAPASGWCGGAPPAAAAQALARGGVRTCTHGAAA